MAFNVQLVEIGCEQPVTRVDNLEKSRGPAWATLIVTSIFIILTSLFILLAFSGFAWNIITEQVFSFWLTILTIGLAISAMAVSTYSFVLYI
ncbi:MAG: hypothetical protein ACFFE7_10370 [Candidatus Thorarchaeota archaeon]